MSEKKQTADPKLPKGIPPELIPLYDWWVKEGRSFVTMLAVAAVAVGGYYAARNWLRGRDAAANAALVNAYTADELEAAVSSYGSTKPGVALKLRLAKTYYDGERYQDALDVYEQLLAKMDKDCAFRDVAEIGRAYALEGLGKGKEAGEAFAAYVADETKKESYLLLTAKLGAARCKALNGDKDGAAKDLDALKETVKDDVAAKMRVERLAEAVKRYDSARAQRSLFDAADDAAKQIDSEKKDAPAAKPAAPAKK